MSINIPHIDVDLRLPPTKRWHALHPFISQARQLLDQYLGDLGDIEQFHATIISYRDRYIYAEYAAELRAIAQLLDVSEEAALIVNLYYDLLKFVLGCTAFAVDIEQGPLHARNLDWWTEMGLLSSATVVANFQGAAAGPFQVVSWPGFTGALSGLAPGRFAITLNAVLSNEPPTAAAPITYLIRSVFETASTFAEAVDRLASTAILSDCLLLVTGIQPGEMVVIERTPTRSALRHPTNGRLIVTNDYLALQANPSSISTEQELQQTSCGRFDRASLLLSQHVPGNVAECFGVLTDPAVQMNITVQHMVMSAAQGILEVRLPAWFSES
jgi:acid ceramidase